MTKEEYAEYLLGEHWGIVREKALERGEYKCALCADTEKLNVHHNTYERLYEELDTDLVVLCERCHKTHHTLRGGEFGSEAEIETIKRIVSVDPCCTMETAMLVAKHVGYAKVIRVLESHRV